MITAFIIAGFLSCLLGLNFAAPAASTGPGAGAGDQDFNGSDDGPDDDDRGDPVGEAGDDDRGLPSVEDVKKAARKAKDKPGKKPVEKEEPEDKEPVKPAKKKVKADEEEEPPAVKPKVKPKGKPRAEDDDEAEARAESLRQAAEGRKKAKVVAEEEGDDADEDADDEDESEEEDAIDDDLIERAELSGMTREEVEELGTKSAVNKMLSAIDRQMLKHGRSTRGQGNQNNQNNAGNQNQNNRQNQNNNQNQNQGNQSGDKAGDDAPLKFERFNIESLKFDGKTTFTRDQFPELYDLGQALAEHEHKKTSALRDAVMHLVKTMEGDKEAGLERQFDSLVRESAKEYPELGKSATKRLDVKSAAYALRNEIIDTAADMQAGFQSRTGQALPFEEAYSRALKIVMADKNKQSAEEKARQEVKDGIASRKKKFVNRPSSAPRKPRNPTEKAEAVVQKMLEDFEADSTSDFD